MKKTKKTLKKEPELIPPPQPSAEEQNFNNFATAYNGLCEQFKVQIKGEFVYTAEGIGIKLVVIKNPDASQ